MAVLINIDVPDLADGARFYADAFGLSAGRRLGPTVVELLGFPTPIYLLENAQGSLATDGAERDYARHWTPVHLDIAVPDIEVALERAVAAGAVLERAIRTEVWGAIAGLADPFGNGFCLIEFRNRGYDEIAITHQPA